MTEMRVLDLHKQVFILVGVGVLSSAPSARWIRNHVPGVHIPDAVIERLERASNPQDEGKQISIEIIRQLRDIEGVAGIHVMAYHQEHAIAEIIERTGVLGGRVCWYPERDAKQASLSASAN